jgi:signal transduction histidine kinase
MLRMMGTALRMASLALLLWVGFAYSRQLHGEVLRQTRLQADLSLSQQALRELSAHRDAQGERARKEVAQEIHDDLGQRLTVLRMDVALLPRTVQADPAGMLPQQVDSLKASIDGIVQVVRDIAGRLRPVALDVGLGPAAESLLREFEQAMGIPCELHNHLPEGLVIEEGRRMGIFRILQESMTNAARHAKASHIHVSLSMVGSRLRLAVQDDGRGFTGTMGGTYGVSGMRERAASMGGMLQISSVGGAGTTVEAWIPLDDDPAPAARSAAES